MPAVDHEKSYRGFALRKFFHRARLRAIMRALDGAALGSSGKLGDFGCSNGFIVSELRAQRLPYPGWELWGFDHAPPYVTAARARGIPGAQFEHFDLDLPEFNRSSEFDVVLCLETLEHTGNYRNGLVKLADAVRPGGHLLISVPNEVGIPGVLKLFGRTLLRGETYEGFFRGRPKWPYLRALLTGADLEAFRDPSRHGWGEHLGFDIRRFEQFLDERLVRTGRLSLIDRRRTGFGFGRIYLLRRESGNDVARPTSSP
jgi:SAM-dependent methyltransferase